MASRGKLPYGYKRKGNKRKTRLVIDDREGRTIRNTFKKALRKH